MMNVTRKQKIALIAPLALAGFALFVALGAQVVHLLWNWLLPAIFGLPAITFWQALGILILTRILFGGFGLGGNRRYGRGRRWQQMSDEERDRFRQKMRERYGCEVASDGGEVS
jgi:hypothetical protein